MGTLYKQGNIWWGYYSPAPGDYRRQSLRTKDKRVAKERLRQLELGATDPPENKTESLGAALDHLLSVSLATNPHNTRKSYEIKSRHLLRLIGDIDLGALTRDAVAGYVSTRTKEGASPNTIYKEMVVLRRALKEATDRDRFHSPVDKVVPKVNPRYKPKRRWLSHDDVDALCDVLPEHRAQWVRLAVLTGARLAEIESLSWGDIDKRTNTLRIAGTKTSGANRAIPISEPLSAFLATLQPHDGLMVGRWPNVRRDLHAACERAGIEPCTPNDLRRTFASHLKQVGMDSFLVAQFLGHSSSRMIEAVYGRVDTNALRDALADYERTMKKRVQKQAKNTANENHKRVTR